MRLRLTVLFVIVTAVAVPATASASEIIDRNANDVSLKVAQNGQALVSYSARGKRWNVLAWGALNAVQPTPGRQAGRVQARLLRRLRHLQEGRVEDVQERLPRVRRPRAAVVHRRLQGVRRLLLGAPVLAADAAELRSQGDPEAVRLGAAALALPRRAARPDREPELGLQEVPPHLRLVHVPRPPGARLQVDVRRRPAGHVRPQPLSSTRSTRPTARAGCARTAS